MKLFTSAMLAVVSLLLASAGSSQTSAPPIHLTFYYFRDVADQQYPDRPIQMSEVRDAKTGHERYSFFDRRTQQHFRDGAQIRRNVAQASAARNGVRLRQLRQEMARWRGFLRHSPVILTESDLEPTCQAVPTSYGTRAVTETLTAQGTRKFARFTKAHVGEINGILVNDAILSAPYVMEPISDSRMEISGGFASLTEAKTLADGLNAAVRRARKP